MTAPEEGLPEMTVELAEVATRLKDRPKVEDVVRAYEIIYGEPPDKSRPAVDVAREVGAALSLYGPSAEKEEPVVTRSSSTEAAAEKPGMTVADLRVFLEGLADDVVPTVRIYYGGAVKAIKAKEKQ